MYKIFIATSSFDLNNFINKDVLEKNKIEIVTNTLARRLTEQEMVNYLGDNVIGLISGLEPITETVLRSCPDLKVISRCGAGIENINKEVARELKIPIFNTPDAPTLAVAELTIALALNSLRKVNQVDHDLKNLKWKPKMGNLIYGKTIGIIGYGRIGSKVGELFELLGAKIIFYDPFLNSKKTHSNFVEFEKLLKSSDIVTLHLPLIEGNKFLIGEKDLKLMKSSSILINLSRGGLVDEDALYNVLKNKHIQGACLDVYQNEPYTGNLTQLDNIILTPHIGSYAKEARDKQEKESSENLFNELCKQQIIKIYE